MKKRIALISACALLVSVFSFAMMPVGAATGDPSAFFYSYKAAEDYNTHVGTELPDQTQSADAIADNLVKTFRADNNFTHHTVAYTWGANAGGNTVLAYDATVGAMKVTVAENYTGNKADYPELEEQFTKNLTTINRPGQVTFMAENDINTSTSAYPYFAIKIKLANKDYAYGAASISTNANAAQGFSTGKVASAGYRATEDWQLLVIKASDVDVQWRALIVNLLAMDTVAVTAGQEVAWIEWAGAFATQADAEAKFVATGGVLPEKSPIFADYTTQAKFDAAKAAGNVAATSSNIALSYDEAGAVKVTCTATEYVEYPAGTIQEGRWQDSYINMKATNEVPVSGNEIVVAKIKPSNSRLLTYSDYALAGSTKITYGANHNYTNSSADIVVGEDGWLYAAYTSEQKVKDAALAEDAVWSQLSVIAHGNYFAPGESYSIAWVGAFEDLTAAKRWDLTGSTEMPTKSDRYFFDFTDGVNTTDKTVPYMNFEGNTAITYDETMKALKVSTADGNTSTANMAKIQFKDDQAMVALKDYPVFAFKMKKVITTGGTMGGITRNDAQTGWPGLTLNSQNTTDWQLVYADASSMADPTKWRNNVINLIQNNPADATLYDGVADTVAYIQWAGAFESVAAAQDYFAATTESSETIPSIAAKPDSASNFYLDFTQGAVVSDEWWNGSESNYVRPEANTALSYDENAAALKVTTKPGQTTSGAIAIDFTPGSVVSNSVTTATHPIFAVKIKLIKTDILPGTYAQMNGSTTGPYLRNMGNVYKDENGTNPITPQGYLFDAYEEDWQLILLDAVNDYDNYGHVNGNCQAKQNNFTTWRGVRVNLSTNLFDPALYDGTAEDIAYIQWAGTFESVAAAEAHFAATTPQKAEEKIDKGAMYLDYRFPTNTAYFFNADARYHLAYGNSQYAFDLSERAIKISSLNKTEANIGGMQLTAAPHYVSTVHPDTGKNFANDLTAYPVYAVKIKFANANLKIKTASACTRGFGSGFSDVTFSEPNGTTDWQILYFTADPSRFLDGQLSYVRIESLTDDTSLLTGDVTDLAWIQWAGSFASLEDAQAWFDYTTPVETDDEDDEEDDEEIVESPLSCNTAGIRKELDAKGNQGLRFYETLKTTLVDGQDTINGKRVMTVNVLMATKASLNDAELTVDNAAANVKVTNCRSRVVNGDTATYVFTALLTDVTKANKATDVTCRAYVVLEDGTIVYGDVATTSVQTMYNAIGAAKFSTAVQQWMA